jgi:hypothetical protein
MQLLEEMDALSGNVILLNETWRPKKEEIL